MKKINISLGDPVDVMLEIDTSEYGMDIPAELSELLHQDHKGNRRFQKLTPGKQRAIIYKISIVKSSQLRIEKSVQIINNLKNLPEGKENMRSIFGIV